MRAGSRAGRRGRGVKTGRGADGYGEETHRRARAADRVQYSNSRAECWLQLILTSKSSSLASLSPLSSPQSVCKCDSHVSVEPPTVTATPYFILTLRRARGQAHKQAGAALKSTTRTAKKNKNACSSRKWSPVLVTLSLHCTAHTHTLLSPHMMNMNGQTAAIWSPSSPPKTNHRCWQSHCHSLSINYPPEAPLMDQCSPFNR